ncbi:MAG: type II toxin-antitoxin system PemK/MazF family toxin [Methanothrix sp.]|nr:type II toxin-antitoxin system PemK/MazF family toxin [Methanothrix sp.]MCX8207958.1 type II toxin-antitoxin system PemK/MazF family toxin [Methanothrix sp.]
MRPALILYEDPAEHEITIAHISSRIPETLSPCDVLVKRDTPSFKEAGLKYDSVIKLNKLATIKDYLIEGLLGVADDTLMAQIDAAIEACLKFKGLNASE